MYTFARISAINCSFCMVYSSLWTFANCHMGVCVLLCSYVHITYAEYLQKKLSYSCHAPYMATLTPILAIIANHDIVAVYGRVNYVLFNFVCLIKFSYVLMYEGTVLMTYVCLHCIVLFH